MGNVVLQVENISKQYRLGQLGTGTISHDLNRAWARLRGKEDPYLKVGDVNDRSVAGGSQYVWSLRNINFEVEQGEVLGIIGKNGAGKSTLLKILSQVTSPTTGQVKVKGRIAALLEVGTGFHPELSGKENIFLNGAILGMTKREIKSKLDEIVDFSGVAKYLDTPVKRYSSGMTVRLGFAIAAHLEPEILIVDEVLAVGDSEFQEKCLGKMKDVSRQGRTVLFVSHNMAAVKNLCSKGLVLQNGMIAQSGDVENSIDYYRRNNFSRTAQISLPKKGIGVDLNYIGIGSIDSLYTSQSELKLMLSFDVRNPDIELVLRIDLWNDYGIKVLREEINFFQKGRTKTGRYEFEMLIPKGLLNAASYSVGIDFIDYRKKSLLLIDDVLGFEILSAHSETNISKRDVNDSVILTDFQKLTRFSPMQPL